MIYIIFILVLMLVTVKSQHSTPLGCCFRYYIKVYSFFILYISLLICSITEIYSITELLRCRKSWRLFNAESFTKKNTFCSLLLLGIHCSKSVSYKQFLILHEFNLCQIFYLFMRWHSTFGCLNSTHFFYYISTLLESYWDAKRA